MFDTFLQIPHVLSMVHMSDESLMNMDDDLVHAPWLVSMTNQGARGMHDIPHPSSNTYLRKIAGFIFYFFIFLLLFSF